MKPCQRQSIECGSVMALKTSQPCSQFNVGDLILTVFHSVSMCEQGELLGWMFEVEGQVELDISIRFVMLAQSENR